MMNSSTLKLNSYEINLSNNTNQNTKPSQKSTFSTHFYDPRNKKSNDLASQFMGQSLMVSDHNSLPEYSNHSSTNFYVQAQSTYCVSKRMRWWEKTMKPNMVEINSSAEFVNALNNAGDQLVVVDFYSPGCGGCKSLHPKICQFAESNPDAIFLKVNYEELKPMCHALHIHVLPFFRFYRGAQGRVCSFSCTISTIKKFKDALAKHSTERCSLGPAKGLDESELIQLSSIGELSTNSSIPSLFKERSPEEFVLGSIGISNPLNTAESTAMLFA